MVKLFVEVGVPTGTGLSSPKCIHLTLLIVLSSDSKRQCFLIESVPTFPGPFQ